MILKASQRSGGAQLAAHLLNDRDNDHVRVFEVRGFAAGDLHGAFQEAHAISRGTKCQQYLFSLSLNPPKGANPGEADFARAADEAEKRLGLTGQPRAIVIHEKDLAQGDRRGFVAVDTDGEVYALARQAGVKTKEVSERLGKPDALPTVADVKRDLSGRIGQQIRGYIKEVRVKQARDIANDRVAVAKLVDAQRRERAHLDNEQSSRFTRETRDRAARFRTGLAGLWDNVTGRKRAIRHQNEAEAIQGLDRDRRQRDALAALQLGQRQPYQHALERTRARHAQDRRLMIREALGHWRRLSRRDPEPTHDTVRPDQTTTRTRRRGPSLDL